MGVPSEILALMASYFIPLLSNAMETTWIFDKRHEQYHKMHNICVGLAQVYLYMSSVSQRDRQDEATYHGLHQLPGSPELRTPFAAAGYHGFGSLGLCLFSNVPFRLAVGGIRSSISKIPFQIRLKERVTIESDGQEVVDRVELETMTH